MLSSHLFSVFSMPCPASPKRAVGNNLGFLFYSLLIPRYSSLSFAFPAAVSLFPAVQGRNSRSSATLPHSRRVCVNLAARLLFPANFCGARVAFQRRAPAFPPFASAAISPTPPTVTSSLIHSLFSLPFASSCL